MLGEPLDIAIPAWIADPRGIYFGGNDMHLTPRAMVAFGELYRNAGRRGDAQVLPETWVRASLEPRTRSPWSGDDYGYGWFLSDAGGHPMFYARGYGGQFVFVVPSLALTMVTTSDPAAGPRDREHQPTIHRILDEWINQGERMRSSPPKAMATRAVSTAPVVSKAQRVVKGASKTARSMRAAKTVSAGKPRRAAG